MAGAGFFRADVGLVALLDRLAALPLLTGRTGGSSGGPFLIPGFKFRKGDGERFATFQILKRYGFGCVADKPDLFATGLRGEKLAFAF